jgi:hypothetical protein
LLFEYRRKIHHEKYNYNGCFIIFLRKGDEKTKSQSSAAAAATQQQSASPTAAMTIPQQQTHLGNAETRLFSTSAPEIDSPSRGLEWFQVKSKKEKSLEKKMRQKQLNTNTNTKVTSSAKPHTSNETTTTTTTTTSTKIDTREELDFMFDEEIPSTHVGNIYANANNNNNNDSFSSSDSDSDSDYDYDYDYDDLDDQTISKLVIITQSPPSQVTTQPVTTTPTTTRNIKHGGIDRTGDFLPRSKITADLARAINDGLYYYEQDLKKKTLVASRGGGGGGGGGGGAFEKTSIVSNEQFSKLKNLEYGGGDTVTTAVKTPLPPPVVTPVENSYNEKASKLTPISIKNKSQQQQQQYSFIPHSLPNDSTLMPSLRQLMSHVNAIKSGAIVNKHARAASNAAGAVGGVGGGGGGGGNPTTTTNTMHRNRNNSGSYRFNAKMRSQREKPYSSKIRDIYF